jgi:hypothetical protein
MIFSKVVSKLCPKITIILEALSKKVSHENDIIGVTKKYP